jgi:hypothetical protein
MRRPGFLAIVTRELLSASRRRHTYWGRSQAAAIALVPTGLILFSQTLSAVAPATLGVQLFRTLAFVSLCYAMLAAVGLTSDCLSSEKREGTLGFLFLTDLKPFDVVVGKLAATSLAGLYGLLAILPIIVIPVLCGGVTLVEVVRLAIVLLNSLFFAVAVALFVSAWSWQARTAASMTFLLLLVISVVLPVASMAVTQRPTPAAGLSLFSPLVACGLATNISPVIPAGAFWVSVLLTHSLGWVFLGLCCRVLPRVWMDRPAEKRRLRWQEFWRQMRMGRLQERLAFRARALAVNPIYWLGGREVRVRWYPWIFLASMAALLVFALVVLRVRQVAFSGLVIIGFALHLFFKQWVTQLASSAFASDRDQGALELLLSTPLTINDLVLGNALVLWRTFGLPLLCLLGVELVGWGFAVADSPTEFEGQLGSAYFWGGCVVFLADLWALTWLGWWKGAVSKNASRATSSTFFQVLMAPCALMAISLVCLYILFDPDQLAFSYWIILFYVLISLGVDGFLGWRARHRLLNQLRLVATERYASPNAALLPNLSRVLKGS